MVQLTNTLGTQNLKEHCNGIVNKHAGYTESQGTLQWQLTNTLGTQNLKEHCNGIVNKHWIHRISRSTAMVQLNTLDTQNLKAMVQLTNTLDTQNLKEHCNGIVNKHPGYTESQGALQWYS